jgi:hypothetical protein
MPDGGSKKKNTILTITLAFSIVVLLLFVGCGGSAAPTMAAVPTDYSQAQSCTAAWSNGPHEPVVQKPRSGHLETCPPPNGR